MTTGVHRIRRIATLMLAVVSGALAAPSSAHAASPEETSVAAGPRQMPYGIMRFAGPPDMEQAPRPRSLPDQAPLLAALAERPKAEALVRFTVTSRGKPRKIEVLTTNDESFARLAKAFVEKIKFRPARANGRSVACEVEMPFALN